MKAIVFDHYGSPEVLRKKEIKKPEPAGKELLIKVEASAVNSGDWRIRKAEPFAVRFFFGFSKPRKKILGGVFSGVVEKTGSESKQFTKGDQVFGSTGMNFGTYAEYTCVPEEGVLAIKPEKISHAEAATVPFGALTALHFLRKAGVRSRMKILVNGASGAVGSAAVQLAKYFNADVTGVCSTANVDLVKKLGADKVIDYTKEDFSRNGETYDVIMDTVNKVSLSKGLNLLNKYGKLVLVSADFSKMIRGFVKSLTSTKKIISGVMSETADDLAFLKKLIEEGNFKPVVDKAYQLDQIAEAHRYVEQGHKKGNVALIVSEQP